MAEETKNTTETKPEVEAPKAEAKTVMSGIGDAVPQAKHQIKEPKAEAPAPKVEAPVETPVKAEVTPAEGTEITNPKEQQTVPVAALQSERKKRQLEQQRALELQKELDDMRSQGVTPEESQVMESKFKNSLLAVSESSARQTHKDFQEKYDAFQAAVFDGDAVNKDLYDMIVNSPHPGEAAYQAGKSILFQKEHGTDLDSQIASIEAKAIARESARIRKELEAEITGKINTKLNQPTNLLHSRSAGSGSETPFRQAGMADVLGRK
jgi:hypothetical protein